MYGGSVNEKRWSVEGSTRALDRFGALRQVCGSRPDLLICEGVLIMDRLRDFVAGRKQAWARLMEASVFAETAVWRAERLEWEAAMWQALQAAQLDPQAWEDLPGLVRQAREQAYVNEVGWDGITYRPEE